MFLPCKNACSGPTPKAEEAALTALRNVKIGRPKLEPDERRDVRLPDIRVTAAERAHVEEQAARAGLSLSEFCRRSILAQRVAPRRATADDRALIELNRVGVNLNQIALAANIGKPIEDRLAALLDELEAALVKVAGDGS